ncbi:glycine zipper family protein [Actinomycetospora sp. TBRC 11914]|nr:glycine zipper family protein [Actinomycetospora sp. TBRC 11914]
MSPTGRPAARPARRAISSHDSYAEAERTVDRLADMDFPVEHVAIIGRDLATVEQVTGKLDYPRAAWRGAVPAAATGALIGWVFGLFHWLDPLVASVLLALYGLVFGAVLGAIVGVLGHALQHGRRDFSSVVMTEAQRFEVVVDEPFADQAIRLLEGRN